MCNANEAGPGTEPVLQKERTLDWVFGVIIHFEHAFRQTSI
jgi:hypothetical protein